MADITFTVNEGTKAGFMDLVAGPNMRDGNAPAGDNFYMPNDGKVILLVTSTAATSAINFVPVLDKFGRTSTPSPWVVTPTTLKLCVIGPFNPEIWNQPNGCVQFKGAAPVATDHYVAVRVGNPT
uniref:Uncharacterized protein n=1 Tax=viral metagenome TaxID=1070528 RepID=A0A6M3LXU8_9ZZZZ